MDPLVTTVLAAALLIALLRLFWTLRLSRRPTREDQIRRKLAELRKKRDED